MSIAFAKPELGDEEAQAACEAILSGWVTQGPRVQAFEEAFAKYCGSQHAVAVSSCTTALHLALVAANIQPGDEVIVPSHTFIGTANSVIHAGATPVLADIDPNTFNICEKTIFPCIGPRTRAIVVVHQVGRPAPLKEIAELSRKYNLTLIEDAACAVGSRYDGLRIGQNFYSPFVCFSFHPRKLITTGDGGMITTNDSNAADRIRRLRQHGMSVNDLQRHHSRKIITEEYSEVGYNYRMTDIQAAVGNVQLTRLDGIIEKRRRIAARYNDAFSSLEALRLYTEPKFDFWNQQTYFVNLHQADKKIRNAFMQDLLDAGIPTRRGIMSIHEESPFKIAKNPSGCPISQLISDTCVALPMHGLLEESQQKYIIDTVKKALDERFSPRP